MIRILARSAAVPQRPLAADPDRAPDIRHPIGQTGDRDRKQRRLLQRGLFVDEVTFVEREQHLRDTAQRPVNAPGDMGLPTATRCNLSVFDAEQDFPREIR